MCVCSAREATVIVPLFSGFQRACWVPRSLYLFYLGVQRDDHSHDDADDADDDGGGGDDDACQDVCGAQSKTPLGMVLTFFILSQRAHTNP